MTPELTERLWQKAGMQVLNDAVMETPTVPLDEGTLRGSGSVFVNNKLIGTSQKKSSGGRPNPAMQNVDLIPEGAVVTVVGFNVPYAARLHEHPEYNFREPGIRAGSSSSEKLIENRNLYLRIVANTLGKYRPGAAMIKAQSRSTSTTIRLLRSGPTSMSDSGRRTPRETA